MENIGIEKAWNHVTKRLLHEKTNLIYDSILKDSDFKYPQEVRTLIHTTNAIEGFN